MIQRLSSTAAYSIRAMPALKTKGSQVQAAKLPGITRATLRKRVEKYGI